MEVRDKVTLLAFLYTIRYVYRTGRIPKVAATVGFMLNIRPILTSSSGLIRFVGAARNKERGIDRLLQLMRKKSRRESSACRSNACLCAR